MATTYYAMETIIYRAGYEIEKNQERLGKILDNPQIAYL